MHQRKQFIAWLTQWLLPLALLCPARGAFAGNVEGFTEPYRTVNLATAEVGVITSLKVHEGEFVKKDQVVAVLDDDVQAALLAIAQKNAELKGRTDAARAELELRRQRLEKLTALWDKGHARREEVERAQADLVIAEGQLLAAEEESAVRRLELERAVVQRKRRAIVAPMDGVISVLHKDEGEFISPQEPNLLNLVQLDKLLATFSVPAEQAAGLKREQAVQVKLADVPTPVKGAIDFISPVTDAESGTVRIKVRIDNPQNKFRSGQRCLLQL